MKLSDPLQNLEGEAKVLAEKMTAKRGKLQGVYKVLFHHPDLASRVSALGDLIRFEGELSSRQKEVVILATARGLRSRFIWQQHEPPARNAGVPEATIESLRVESQPADTLDRLFCQLTQSCLLHNAIPPKLSESLVAEVGQKGTIEAVAIIGFYCMIDTVASSFEVALPRAGEQSF